MKYVALLRGINVGGNNKVSMQDLKSCVEDLGFTNVVTYINSGNIIFEYKKTPLTKLITMCEEAIQNKFGFHVVCTVISAADLQTTVEHAPSWWNKGDGKHNAIFVIPPITVDEVMGEVGTAKPEYEKVAAYAPIIFWSAPLKTFSRTRYSKIVSTSAYQSITIRNANTTLKLVNLCK